jgi:phosphoglycerate dehydrogenase-like enzyme
MCAVPGTSETAGMVDRELLESLAEDPIVVNNGRGPVIDEASLAELVRSGRIRRIGLDVWWRYPRDGEAPFWGGDREMIESAEFASFSPHAGSHVAGGEEERAAWLAASIRELAEGREPSGRSDPLRGY